MWREGVRGERKLREHWPRERRVLMSRDSKEAPALSARGRRWYGTFGSYACRMCVCCARGGAPWRIFWASLTEGYRQGASRIPPLSACWATTWRHVAAMKAFLGMPGACGARWGEEEANLTLCSAAISYLAMRGCRREACVMSCGHLIMMTYVEVGPHVAGGGGGGPVLWGLRTRL